MDEGTSGAGRGGEGGKRRSGQNRFWSPIFRHSCQPMSPRLRLQGFEAKFIGADHKRDMEDNMHALTKG